MAGNIEIIPAVIGYPMLPTQTQQEMAIPAILPRAKRTRNFTVFVPIGEGCEFLLETNPVNTNANRPVSATSISFSISNAKAWRIHTTHMAPRIHAERLTEIALMRFDYPFLVV